MQYWGSRLLIGISMLLLGGSCGLFAFKGKWSVTSAPALLSASSTLSTPCEYRQEGEVFWIPAHCALQGKLPTLPITTIIDLLREDIENFTEIYQPFEQEYRYYGAKPLFKQPFSFLLDGSYEANQQLIQFAQQEKEIQLTTYELARYWVQHIAFYVSEKDLSLLSPCNTQNYTLALQKLDGYLLSPGSSFNANRELSKVKGYCTGRGEANFLFYGGVCGMTAQVFRTTLIHPNIEIVKRRPHNEWFVQYYGEEIGGDDAAIYEMSKQFEIKNIGTDDIYFKVKRNAKHTLLIAISPRTPQRVEISKQPLTQRSITLERKIWEDTPGDTNILAPSLGFSLGVGEKADNLLRQDTFSSVYMRKNYEMR